MYDICLIGSGIIGKYLVHHLQGHKVAWVSSSNRPYISPGEYKLGNYLGTQDTWTEKATGLISFPSVSDIKQFPFTVEQYREYAYQLKAELNLKNLATLKKRPEYKAFIGELESIFPEKKMRYFLSSHQSTLGPSFSERVPYDRYWLTQKLQWFPSSFVPDYCDADFFLTQANKAIALIGKDKDGTQFRIEAKHFIVACHTPGTIALLDKTFAHSKSSSRKFLGRYFSDHAQLSFGVLLPNTAVPRTTLASFCFQDCEYEDIPYRLEFHIAPPKAELIRKTRMRLPQFSTQDFEYSFLRIVVVLHPPSEFGSRLQLKGRDYLKASTSESFLLHCRQQRNKLLPFLQNKFFQDQRIVLLNQHFPLFFAGHLTGGIAFPTLVDNCFRLNDLSNVSIAGSAVFPTNGLFNPTFTSLLCAKHILASLPIL